MAGLPSGHQAYIERKLEGEEVLPTERRTMPYLDMEVMAAPLTVRHTRQTLAEEVSLLWLHRPQSLVAKAAPPKGHLYCGSSSVELGGTHLGHLGLCEV